MNIANENGKTYIKDSLTYNCRDGFYEKGRPKQKWEGLAFEKLNDLFEVDEWEETIEYVTFAEALEHMKNGGKAKLDDRDYHFTNNFMYFEDGEYTGFPTVTGEMLEPKWVLL